ncbi:hypothetical protein PTMSG1_00321 [Pyrenophora teres f. maculata]|nr:hypothetical protein PTMSG1_00321 [Pyrenophora teres f. maculata]
MRIERRVEMWRNLLPGGATPFQTYAAQSYRKDDLEAKYVTNAVGDWIIEANALSSLGMPTDVFSLILDGGETAERTSEVFKTVHRDCAWQKAFEISVTRSHFNIPPDISRWGHRSCGYRGLPKAIADMVQGNSIVKCNFDTGGIWDEQEIEELVQEGRNWSFTASNSKPAPPRKSSDEQRRQSAALEGVGSRPRRAQRRPTKETSYELTNHAKAYLEGGQYASGYNFLYSLLAAGTSISTPAQPYMGCLAPPAYIAFASSLIADPKFTTKAQSRDEQNGPDAALRYLQCICTTIDGPAYPTVREAFAFPEERTRRRAPGHRAAAIHSPGDNSDINRIVGEAANENSLWYRADDFWHIVGWAFNCSVAHKKRWSRWKLWLSNMLDFIDADWQVCVRESKTEDGSDDAALQQSLLWYYIIGDEFAPTNRGRQRRIVKAILAMATSESLKEYPEIWDRETAEPKKKSGGQRVGKVSFETGEMADYESDEEMQDVADGADDEDASDTPLDNDEVENIHEAVERLGGHDAIQLRHRLIAILAQIAQALPKHFTPLFDLCDNILEDFNVLPTVMLQVLLSTMKMPDTVQIAFLANLLNPLITGKPPNLFLVDPTQEHFEGKLLSLKGTTQSFATNAKISLILEQMVMHMMSQDALLPTPALRKAMETGIKARESVNGIKRGNAGEEEQANVLMQACSERLLGLMEILEMTKGEMSKPTKGKGKVDVKEAALLSFGSGSSLSPAPDSETEPED